MNSRQLDFEMGLEIEALEEVLHVKEPTPPPPPPKPKPVKKKNDQRKEQLKKIRYMLDYFEQFELPEFCSENVIDNDACQECEWESNASSLSGSLKDLQLKIYHAVLRYRLHC
jgi:hypothetical protein